MNKKKIITISVLSGILCLLLLTIIVFSAVFRVGAIDVVFSNELPYVLDNGEKIELSTSQIVAATGFKKGKSSLFLDKDKAKTTLETTYPYIKVNSISLTSARRVEIDVSARYEMFSYSYNEKFYVLDEELKVLKIVDAKPENLIPISSKKYLKEEKKDLTDSNILSISNDTKAGDFVGGDFYRQVFKNLYVSLYRYVLVDENSMLNYTLEEGQTAAQALESGSLKYAERADILKFLTQIEFYGSTHYSRIILSTSCGVRVDIASPDANLDGKEGKINKCFSIIPTLDADDNEDTTSASGTIVFDYDNSVRYYFKAE